MRPAPLLLALSFAVAGGLSAGLAHADDPLGGPSEVPTTEVSPPPGPTSGPSEYGPPLTPRKYADGDLHTYLEARLGAATILQHGAGYGPSVDVSYGLGWTWLDVGAVGHFAALPMSGPTDANAYQYALGLELATRTSIGGGTTFRFGLDPLYSLESFGGSTHSSIGADALAQLLFTVDDSSRPVWRLGLGFHGGRRWPTSGGEGTWIVGADLIVRTFW
jgi:hypothetical protein